MIKSGSIILSGQVANIGEKRNACRFFTGQPEESRTPRRSIHRLEDDTKMDITEMG
jgi:hypothetical protein